MLLLRCASGRKVRRRRLLTNQSTDRPTDGCCECVCVCPPFLDSIRQDTRLQKEEEKDARLSSSFQCVKIHYYIIFLFCVCVWVCAGKRPNWSFFFLSFFLVCFFFYLLSEERRGERKDPSVGWTDGMEEGAHHLFICLFIYIDTTTSLCVCESDIRDDEKRRDIHLLSSSLVSSQVGDVFKRNCAMNKIQLQVHERRKRRRIAILPAQSCSETLPAAQNKVSSSSSSCSL